jgi:ELWxxDGT repeat protein
MKTKNILLMPVAFMFTALMLNAQSSLYPQGDIKIPFGKKLPPPSLSYAQEKNTTHIPHVKFNPVTKQMEWFFPNQNQIQNNPQPHANGATSNNNMNSVTSNIHLVKDINKVSESNPSNFSAWTAYNPPSFAVLNNVTYFAADDGVHGIELWRSDGTAAGTYIVKDINPGSNSSNIRDITAANNKIYFSAFTDAEGQEPWVSDGTKAGTQLLFDINTDYRGAGSNPNEFVNVNGTVFFIANGAAIESAIWKTDGTAAGTLLVKDLGYSDNAQAIFMTTAANGLLFFAPANSNYGRELWRSDGTYDGTYMVKDINPFGDSDPLQLTEFNNKLYFSADDGSGRKLWMSDGTYEGTVYAPNNNNVILQGDYYAYYFNQPFTVVKKTMYFWAYADATGWELYKYKPSVVANIELVKNISPGVENTQFNYYEMRDVNDTLFFETTNSKGGSEIWMSSGFASNTQKVKSFSPGEYISNLYNGYNTLYFIKFDSTYGYELWKSNGTDAGTVIVKDIYPGSTSANPYWLTACNGKVFFSAASPNKGMELWLTDGSADGTKQAKDINQTTTSSSAPYAITSYADGVVFTAFTKEHGNELYKSDGTEAGTKLLNDITPGEGGTNIQQFISKGNKVYFPVGTSAGYSVYKTDGTTSGLKKVADLPLSVYFWNFAVADNGHLFFLVFNYFTGSYELWGNDGSGGESVLLASNLYYTNNLITIGNTAFFVAGDDVNGYELWKSDGTVEKTKMVKDIYPGINSSFPSGFYNFNGKLFFSADNGLGPFLWSSDGTNAGTKLVKGIYVQNIFAQANGKLFFNGYNIVGKGYELYATDGTAYGTKLVKDINPGPASSSPYSLVSGDTLLYFLADDGKHGAELWASNGTSAGTHLVKNITPGVDPSYFTYMVNVHDNLFFTMNDTLWQSDGTKEGTAKINLGVSNFSYLTAYGNTLFFSGYTYATGQELYAGTVTTGFKPAASLAQNAIASSKANNIFEARLLSNPITNQLKLAVTLKEKQNVQIIITDAAGRILKSEKQTLSQNSNMLSYDTQAWPQGLYVIRIISADGSSALLKAIK